MSQKFVTPQFLMCVSAGAYPASLEVSQLYRVIPDDFAATKGFVRVIDESGEDYLYPRQLFATADLPGSITVKRVVGAHSMLTAGRKKSKFHAKYLMTKGLRRTAAGSFGLNMTTHVIQRPVQPDGLPAMGTRPRR